MGFHGIKPQYHVIHISKLFWVCDLGAFRCLHFVFNMKRVFDSFGWQGKGPSNDK